MKDDLSLDLFDYYLPRSDIAQTPSERRDASRLLVLDRKSRAGDPRGMTHCLFRDLARFLRPGDCLVLNRTRVIPARLQGLKLPTGGAAEIFLVDPLGAGEWVALLRPARRLRPGTQIEMHPAEVMAKVLPLEPQERIAALPARGLRARVLEDLGEGRFRIGLDGPPETDRLEALGLVPLPPYITRPLEDPSRYQTVYAEEPGSVAAPTAGLHFTPELFRVLEASGVQTALLTLHIGLGTFQPVRERDIREHNMHREYVEVPQDVVDAVARARAARGRVIAVGTTAVRALEGAAADGDLEAFAGQTDLFIYPGYRFRVVDALITNFHLPRSTLLMLVSALAGRERIMAAYREARRRGYRFYSFGDAMFIL